MQILFSTKKHIHTYVHLLYTTWKYDFRLEREMCNSQADNWDWHDIDYIIRCHLKKMDFVVLSHTKGVLGPDHIKVN